jgi:hypothetical protein
MESFYLFISNENPTYISLPSLSRKCPREWCMVYQHPSHTSAARCLATVLPMSHSIGSIGDTRCKTKTKKSLQRSCESIAASHHPLRSVIMRYQDPTAPSWPYLETLDSSTASFTRSCYSRTPVAYSIFKKSSVVREISPLASSKNH